MAQSLLLTLTLVFKILMVFGRSSSYWLFIRISFMLAPPILVHFNLKAHMFIGFSFSLKEFAYVS